MAETNPSPLGGAVPGTTSINTASPGALYPQGDPEPTGTTAGEETRAAEGANTDPTAGSGVDGELVVWEGTYSAKNFVFRWVLLGLVAIGWGVIIAKTDQWRMPSDPFPMSRFAFFIGVIVVGLACILGYRMLLARYSHYYRLTTRRLFVSTGFIHRRRDAMELLRVKDVFTRQLTLMDRVLGLGTVVVAPTDKDIPTLLLAGVNEPKRVMDLIWHHARAERDQRSVKVDSV